MGYVSLQEGMSFLGFIGDDVSRFTPPKLHPRGARVFKKGQTDMSKRLILGKGRQENIAKSPEIRKMVSLFLELFLLKVIF